MSLQYYFSLFLFLTLLFKHLYCGDGATKDCACSHFECSGGCINFMRKKPCDTITDVSSL